MPKSPSPINQPAKTANEVIQFALYEVAVKALKNAVYAEAPYLKIPPLSWIFEGVLNWVTGKLYTMLSQTATFVILDIQTDAERRAYSAAEGALREAMLIGNQEAINDAARKFKAALGSLVHFDGSAPA
jgi:hypothetical protein